MTSRTVAERVSELKREGKIPQNATVRVLDSGLTYDQALAMERRERRSCGTHCDGDEGGPRDSGFNWTVYRCDW